MKVVVPLAGPDLEHPVHGLKPLHMVEGRPLLALALESRPWFASGEVTDMAFVLREGAATAQLEAFLKDRYPSARRVMLSHITDGALLSALIGAAACAGTTQPLCIDLADILYDWPDYDGAALWSAGAGAVVPVFESQSPAFSYLRRRDGRVVEAAEKQVISSEASAGTYLFANLGVFLTAAAHSMSHADRLAHKGALFVCPTVNGVIAADLQVEAPTVANVRAASTLLQSEGTQDR